jgi:hypothetical protein
VEVVGMTILHPDQSSEPKVRRTSSVGLAWIALAWLPVSLVLGFVVGEVLLSALGYPSGNASGWASAVADVAAGVVCGVPCVVGAAFAWRAKRAGERNAIRPLITAALLGIVLVGIIVAAVFGDLVG